MVKDPESCVKEFGLHSVGASWKVFEEGIEGFTCDVGSCLMMESKRLKVKRAVRKFP